MASESSPLLVDHNPHGHSAHPSPTVRQSFVTPSLLWRAGSILSTTGIIAGAFGSHGLKSRLTSDALDSWKIGSNYAIFNGLALLAISMHPRFGRHPFAGPAILLGTSIFSGSIALLVLDRDRFKFLGPITPLGGTIMIAGYIALAL